MNIEEAILLDDSYAEWGMIYLAGGEDLLRAYSERIHTPERGLGQTVEESHLRRLLTAVSDVATTPEEIERIAYRIPENFRYALIKNKNCPAELVEEFFIGKYYNGCGEPMFDSGARIAHVYHHDLALEIFCRRTDLHQYMTSSTISLFKFLLRRKWKLPLPEYDNKETMKLLRIAETGIFEE